MAAATKKLKLKPVEEQVIVITGASSGIGLVTARAAAKRGARVVLSARNERALQRAVADIEAAGGQAIYVVADVADERDVDHLADVAVREFGGFDTWVNNASVAIYGRLDQVSVEDMRRLFDVNFWGVVHGCNAALPHLKARGGVLVNVGSVLSDRAIPLQGIYAAAKHAVKAYTDTLRMELEREGAPVSVTLVKPASIDTPFFQHARNYLSHEPKPAPPVYDPKVAAETILAVAARPVRDVFVGGAGKMVSLSGTYAPRLTDKAMERSQFEGQQYADRPSPPRRPDNLYAPMDALEGVERGIYDGPVRESSTYTAAALHPVASTLAAVGLGLALAASVRALRGRRADDVDDLDDAGDAGDADDVDGLYALQHADDSADRPTGRRRTSSRRTGTGPADGAESRFHVPS